MRRLTRGVVSLVLVVGCVLSLGGCGVMSWWPFRKPDPTPSSTAPDQETAKALMLAELESRYGVEFEAYGVGMPEFSDPVYTMGAHLVGDMSRYHIVYTRWRASSQPVSEMEDDYLQLKMLPWFEEEVRRRVDAVFPQNLLLVKLHNGTKSKELAYDISWEDYREWALLNASLGITIVIPVEPGVAKEDVQAQLSGLMTSAVDLGVSVVGVELRAHFPNEFDKASRYYNRQKDSIRGADVFDYTYGRTEMIVTKSWRA